MERASFSLALWFVWLFLSLTKLFSLPIDRLVTFEYVVYMIFDILSMLATINLLNNHHRTILLFVIRRLEEFAKRWSWRGHSCNN